METERMSDMRMTLYCGPLTRYYAHDWPGALTSGKTEPLSEIETLVRGWRDMACEAAEDEIGIPVFWEENPKGACVTADPGWEGWYGLLLWALYRDQEKKPEPLPSHWLKAIETLPVFAAAQKRKTCRYPTLAANCEMFLPFDADVVLYGPDPAGEEEIPIGSACELVRELEALNRDTWNASERDIASWETESDTARTLETYAKRGFAALLRVARAAVRMTQPIRLDYDD